MSACVWISLHGDVLPVYRDLCANLTFERSVGVREVLQQHYANTREVRKVSREGGRQGETVHTLMFVHSSACSWEGPLWCCS